MLTTLCSPEPPDPSGDFRGDFTVPEDFDPIPPNEIIRWDDQRLFGHPSVPRDWEGETVVVIASGPSFSQEQADHVSSARAKGRCRVIGVNNAFHRIPRLDAIYALDPIWWKEYQPARFYHDARHKLVRPEFWCGHERGICYDAKFTGLMPMGNGTNSGLHGVILAARKGAGKIIMLGFDYHVERGRHWHRDHATHMRNPDAMRCRFWKIAFERLWPRFRDSDVELVNCSPGTALRAVPRSSLHKELPLSPATSTS